MYGHLGKHAGTACTLFYRLYGFVQYPSSKYVPKNCTVAAVLFSVFVPKVTTVPFLENCAQFCASNYVLNADALFLDFCASLSWKQCLSPAVRIPALGFVPINVVVLFVESPHYYPLSSHYSENLLSFLLSSLNLLMKE